MNRLLVTLAQAEPSELLEAQKQYFSSGTHEVLIMSGGIFVAIAIGTLWAIYYSKKKKSRPHRPHRRDADKDRPLNFRVTEPAPTADDPSRKKFRKQRRPHRPMNPTLAQTRGLPPLRDENTPLPPMP